MSGKVLVSRITLRGKDDVEAFLDGLLRDGYEILQQSGKYHIWLGKYE